MANMQARSSRSAPSPPAELAVQPALLLATAQQGRRKAAGPRPIYGLSRRPDGP